LTQPSSARLKQSLLVLAEQSVRLALRVLEEMLVMERVLPLALKSRLSAVAEVRVDRAQPPLLEAVAVVELRPEPEALVVEPLAAEAERLAETEPTEVLLVRSMQEQAAAEGRMEPLATSAVTVQSLQRVVDPVEASQPLRPRLLEPLPERIT
jgi:hypothetical protein